MGIHEYFIQKGEINKLLLQYIDSENDSDLIFQNLISFIEGQKITENRKEFQIFLRVVISISNNHHRIPGFFSKIEQILLYFKDNIKQTFSNHGIFKFFKSNKQIILSLLKNNVITLDQPILKCIFQQKSVKIAKFFNFFYPEVKSLINEENKKKIETKLLNFNEEVFSNYEEKRKIGENDFYLCELIRNDSIEEFDSYLTKTNISHSSIINPSIFETNTFLIKRKKITLIEYAAFFGSIQIFQYLKMNNVQLKPSLWLYAIHSRSAELIHLLEEYHVEPRDKTYHRCFEEAIKCHHNEIARYIHDNLLKEEKIENDFSKCRLGLCFYYYNFAYFPNEFDINVMFSYLCYYNYYNFVEILLKNKDLNLNAKMISKKNNFF